MERHPKVTGPFHSMQASQINHTTSQSHDTRIDEYRSTPEFGPSLLFFSGGTALNRFSSTLKHYTHNSIHLVTPFDSGGSSAVLRKAFAMPSIGDLRSRLIALADETVLGHPEVTTLFTTRLSNQAEQKILEKQLQQLVSGESPLMMNIGNPIHQLICDQLAHFLRMKPADFDLHGASIGNLILAGGYLMNQRQLAPTIYLFSKLVGVQGTVKLIANADLHLVAKLTDGQQILGQHRLTGKECPAITVPIARLLLSKNDRAYEPATTCIDKQTAKLIQKADLICYPPGSFYTSVLANLLPQGVCKEIAKNLCPKIYIPNLGHDPEQVGMELDDCLQTLIDELHAGCDEATPTNQLLSAVLIDDSSKSGPSQRMENLLEMHRIELIRTPLIDLATANTYDNKRLAEALLRLTCS